MQQNYYGFPRVFSNDPPPPPEPRLVTPQQTLYQTTITQSKSRYFQTDTLAVFFQFKIITIDNTTGQSESCL